MTATRTRRLSIAAQAIARIAFARGDRHPSASVSAARHYDRGMAWMRVAVRHANH